MTRTSIQQAIETLSVDLQNGTCLPPRRGGYYLSDPPLRPGLRNKIRGEQVISGLWPVFLSGFDDDPEDNWPEFGLTNVRTSDQPQARSAEGVLLQRWNEMLDLRDLLIEDHAKILSETSPFNQKWPGLAPATTLSDSTDEIVDDLSDRLINDPGTVLGLFQVERGADVPWAAGWMAGDDITPIEVSAVLRSWEDRFGARLLRLGRNSLVMGVAKPPDSLPLAQRIAAEHYAFCWENFGVGAGALMRYAEELVGMPYWSFCWEREPSDDLDD